MNISKLSLTNNQEIILVSTCNSGKISLDESNSKEKGEILLFFIHGGAWITNNPSDFIPFAQGILETWSRLYPPLYSLAIALPSYPLSTADGGVKHPAHVEALVEALEHLATTHRSTRIICGGHSVGATMTFLLWPRLSEQARVRIKGWFGLEGIYDLPLLLQQFPHYQAWFVDLAINSSDWLLVSPSLSLSPLPEQDVLLVHSQQDELVNPGQSIGFYEKLTNCGINVEIELERIGGGHDEMLNTLELAELLCKFCYSHLPPEE